MLSYFWHVTSLIGKINVFPHKRAQRCADSVRSFKAGKEAGETIRLLPNLQLLFVRRFLLKLIASINTFFSSIYCPITVSWWGEPSFLYLPIFFFSISHMLHTIWICVVSCVVSVANHIVVVQQKTLLRCKMLMHSGNQVLCLQLRFAPESPNRSHMKGLITWIHQLQPQTGVSRPFPGVFQPDPCRLTSKVEMKNTNWEVGRLKKMKKKWLRRKRELSLFHQDGNILNFGFLKLGIPL